MAVRSFLRRAGWLFLATLFIVTGLGVGVVAFWQATHPPKTDTNQATTCTVESAPSSAVFPKPEAFKPSGKVTSLQTTDLEQGNGEKVKSGDCLTVKYQGTLVDGQEFDGNFDKPTVLKFKLGQHQVIEGWDQGVVGMKVGGLRRLTIPPELGYGSQAQSVIPANSTLVFVVKVISVEQ